LMASGGAIACFALRFMTDRELMPPHQIDYCDLILNMFEDVNLVSFVLGRMHQDDVYPDVT
jgi:hypothetical protein